tara:strand:+ start:286 stop:618 length:333 start_codon:yes stop_codon:yes gene_type:complete
MHTRYHLLKRDHKVIDTALHNVVVGDGDAAFQAIVGWMKVQYEAPVINKFIAAIRDQASSEGIILTPRMTESLDTWSRIFKKVTKVEWRKQLAQQKKEREEREEEDDICN